ncbi:N-6 DNA methylase [bacterium]|nr:N-6 DNA methylase [bacterium]
MATLINQKLLKSCVEKFNFPDNNKRQRIDEIISAWQTAFKDHDLSKAKETSLQGKFFSKFFCEILGYTMQDDGQEVWTLKQEAKTEVDGKEADGSLGYYSKTSAKTRCVIELKDAQCNLDSKQQSRESKQTPVEQAFQYLYKFADCDWVIVSNFRYTRLYHKSKGQTAYEEFDILNLHEEKEFKRFYYCLCKENLLNENSCSQMDLLIKQSGEADIDITKEFYAEFKTVRKILFEHIIENNPNFDKKLLLEKTQKLLDRFIFIFFCEDTAGLLPHNTVENIYKMAQNSFSLSECKIWEQFRGLFVAIDKGNNNVNPPINAYNGGLFAYDEILDKLIIKDEMFTHIKELARYDFESDLNVNILGHIFEQSLSDLEQIKNELDGIQEDKKNSKRKKDGIFYTPEYITHYIVEETIGKYLEENPDKLETIKILDPACGSGAFLNQAHSFLLKQRQIQVEENIKNADKSQLNLFKHTNQAEHDRSILLNNLFGVDLNKESVEITKLALWLKTANSKCKLNNLDENIKCGNSLIDDENIAGDKAFKWENEYKDIMQNGGFDVIIGNPPYGASLNDESKQYMQLNYKDVIVRYLNTYNFFIKKSIDLLKEGGYLSFILPNTMLYQLEDKNTREYLLKNCEIKTIINLGDGIFDSADVPTCIFIVKKIKNSDYQNYNYADLRIYKFSDIELDFNNYVTSYNIDCTKNDNFHCFGINDNFEKIYQKTNINKTINDIAETVSQGIITGGNPIYIFDDIRKIQDTNIDKELLKPILRGENIFKYLYEYKNSKILYVNKFTDINNYPNTLKYLEQFKEKLSQKRETKKGTLPYWSLWWARTEDLFNGEKILLRQTGDRLIATYDIKNYFALDSLLILKLMPNQNYKYILTLLNSKLLQYIYTNITQESGRTFAQVKATNIKRLPIPNATEEQQNSLSQKADRMIELNKSLKEESQKAIELIELEYKPKKVSQNLMSFYTLGLNPFIEELEKQGVKLSLTQKEDLISWYKTKSDQLNKIKSEIDTLDRQIDQEVYKLYNLTPEEIQIIEGQG